MQRTHNILLAGAVAALTAGIAADASAVEYGTVVSRAAVYAQVAVPQQQCFLQPQVVQPARSGAGGLLGALVGGVAGNAIGHGSGRALATGIGMVGGALLGDHAEAGASPPSTVNVQQCQTVNRYDSHLVGYDVVYQYNGQNHSTRLAHDPGAPGTALPLNVSVSPAAMGPAAPATPVAVSVVPQVVYTPPPVVVAPAAYVAPTVGVGIGAGWEWEGGHSHWH